MKEERARQLLERIRKDLPPGKMEVPIKQVKAKIDPRNTKRLIKSWGPEAKGTRAFFEVEKRRKEKWLVLLNETERKLMNIRGLEPSTDSRLILNAVWKAARFEKTRTDKRLKNRDIVSAIAFSVLFPLICYLIVKLFWLLF